MAGVTAVIPHWNRKDLLLEVLDRLRRQTRPPDEILVVDNGSEDGSPECAEAAGARVVRMGRNAGFAAAVNRGIGESRTEWIAVLNNDVQPEPEWLDRLLAAAARPGLWFATGKLLRMDNPGLLDGAFDLPSRAGCAWRAGNGRADAPLWNDPREIRSAPFTAALFRSELFRDIGPLDERFGSYLEDVDFGLRCAAAGRSGLYVPAAVARHHGSATLGEWSPAAVRWIARNQLLLVARHAPDGLGWPAVAGQLLWGFLALRHGAFLAWLRGKAGGLRLYGSLRRKFSAAEAERLRSLFEESERQIRTLQRQAGADMYWRMYFALT